MGINHSRIGATNNCIHNIMRYRGIGQTLQYLAIFIKYIIAHAQDVSSLTKGLLCRAIGTMQRDHLHQAIGIKYNLSAHCL